MKKMIATGMVAALALACGACERHDWEETKALHETHGHGGGDHGKPADDHGKPADDHGTAGDHKDAAGQEKKAEH